MSGRAGRIFGAMALALGLVLTTGVALSQTAAPAAPAQSATPQASPAPQAVTPAPAPAATQNAATAPASPGEGDLAKPIDIEARPAVVVAGAAKWDDGYKSIMAAVAKARAAVLKANLKEGGRPLAAFVDTDDDGFKYEAMIPLEAAPTSPVDLGADAKIGATPAGKAIKFQHRGAYDDVDSTYEAITAYLDEKGYEAQNVFVEEYVNDPKGSDDSSLALDIYVFIK